MLTSSAVAAFVALRVFAMIMAPASQVGALPVASITQSANASITPGVPASPGTTQSSSSYWLSTMRRQGAVPFGNSTSYSVYRSVKDYGAKGKSCFCLFIGFC